MRWVRSEEEVEMIIDELVKKTKGNYITQGVAFNKNKKNQMDLLRMVLRSSYSFGGFIKEMLAEKFNEESFKIVSNNLESDSKPDSNTSKPIKEFKAVENTVKEEDNKKEVNPKLDVGNFLL